MPEFQPGRPLNTSQRRRFISAASASATRCRIAFDSDGLSSCSAAHASTARRSSGGMRTPTIGECPIAGRPRTLFLCLTPIATRACLTQNPLSGTSRNRRPRGEAGTAGPTTATPSRTGDNKPTKLDAETLAALCVRLLDQVDSIVNVVAHEMEQDMRTAHPLSPLPGVGLSRPATEGTRRGGGGGVVPQRLQRRYRGQRRRVPPNVGQLRPNWR